MITAMQTLEPPYTHFLSAAEGWVELGNTLEATAELDRIPDELQNVPAVLAARALLRTAPEIAAGWLHQSYALRRLPEGSLSAAWEALFPALERFPDETLVPYNLACYACQLGRLDEARGLLHRAMNSKRQFVKQIALADADLEPLWGEIRKL
jgi:tetratricopeptide (TPR) repeat protein